MLACFFLESCAQHFYLQRGFHFTMLILNSGRRFWFRISPSLQGKLGTSWPLFKSCFCSCRNCYFQMGGASGQVLLKKFQQKVFPISSSAVLTGILLPTTPFSVWQTFSERVCTCCAFVQVLPHPPAVSLPPQCPGVVLFIKQRSQGLLRAQVPHL